MLKFFSTIALTLVISAALPARIIINPANGHAYEAVSAPGGIMWTQARAAAETRIYNGSKGYLVSITSSEEQDFLSEAFPSAVNQGWWIGAFKPAPTTDPLEGWAWASGEAWDFANWMPGQPDNNYPGGRLQENAARFTPRGSGQWSDVPQLISGFPGDAIGGFIVEYSAPAPQPEPPGNTASASITLAASDEIVRPGSSFRVLITVASQGGSTLEQARAVFPILPYLQADTVQNPQWGFRSDSYAHSFGDLHPGDSRSAELELTVAPDAPDGLVLNALALLIYTEQGSVRELQSQLVNITVIRTDESQPLTLISPADAQPLFADRTCRITWAYNGEPCSGFTLELIKDGARVLTIAQNIPAQPGGVGHFDWTVPGKLANGDWIFSSGYRIRLKACIGGQETVAETPEPFTIGFKFTGADNLAQWWNIADGYHRERNTHYSRNSIRRVAGTDDFSVRIFRDSIGRWMCSQMATVFPVSYGEFAMITEGNLYKLDHSAFFGMFTYNLKGYYTQFSSEIDIEFSRWGNPADPGLLQMTAQPGYVGNGLRYTRRVWPKNLTFCYHRIEWKPDEIACESGALYSSFKERWTLRKSALYGGYSNQWSSNPYFIPKPLDDLWSAGRWVEGTTNSTRFLIGIYLYGGRPYREFTSADGTLNEIIIREVTYLPY